MITWLEYHGQYQVSGDKVYVEKIDVSAPLWKFPLYDEMPTLAEVWLVYGPAIRAFLNKDWFGSGHHYTYPFIKTGEIWLESNVYDEDRSMLFYHESITRFLMSEVGLSYPEAKIIADAYVGSYVSEEYLSGKRLLKSFYPKKNKMTIEYKPPRLTKKGEGNIELAEFKAAKESLLARHLTGEAWDQIFDELDKLEEDLSNLPI